MRQTLRPECPKRGDANRRQRRIVQQSIFLPAGQDERADDKKQLIAVPVIPTSSAVGQRNEDAWGRFRDSRRSIQRSLRSSLMFYPQRG